MSTLINDFCENYFVRFQISSNILHEFNHEKKIEKIEIFAIINLFYEIIFEKKSFEKLIDNEMQHYFINENFFDNVAILFN